MEMQELDRDNLKAALAEAFPVIKDTPEDMLELLGKIDGVKFCREVALDLAGERLSRLLNNTANQSS